MTADREQTRRDARIRFTITATVTLESLWYDEQWHRELLADGLSESEALRKMVRGGFDEDGLSIIWEMFGPPPETGKYFAQAITDIAVVDV